MRLLYVSHSFPLPDRPLSNVGGMQRVAVDLHRAFAADPEIELHSLLLETTWRWTGVRTPPFLLSLLARIPRIVAAEGVQVVLFSSMVTAAVSPLVRNRIRRAGAIIAAIPVGRDVTLPNPAYQRFVPNVFDALDLVLPISRATAEACIARGAPPGKVHIIPCGTDLGSAAGQQIDRDSARTAVLDLLAERRVPLPPEPLLLLSVGRHQERKGFQWFVDEVMPGTPEHIVYVLVGSGPTTDRIRQTVERHGLERRVVLLGQVSQPVLKTLYSGCDLFVMPNIPVPGDIEGFGVVMVEAGAAGLPVIAANLEGIRDVIAEGQSGVLVGTRDVAAFTESILRYDDRRELAAASSGARAYVREHFAWPAIAKRYIEIFREELRTSTQPPAQA
ncbi:MAG: glycosyltransferase [Gemmatimonas sp.]|nr:glycosyltransferase [Gemmatimonas sp.]